MSSVVLTFAHAGLLSTSETTPDRTNVQLYEEGIRLLGNKDYDKAIITFSQALAQGSTEIGVLVARGRAYYELHRYSEALNDVSKALREKPNHIYGLFLRAAIYDRSGRTLDAVKDLSTVLLMDPQNVTAYGFRGAAYSTLNLWNDALSDYNRAAALGDHSHLLYKNRAVVHENLGNYDLAVGDLSRSLELKPGDEGLLSHRSWMYLCLSDLAKGLEDLNTLIIQNPNDMRARVRRGWAYLAMKKFSAAVSDLSYAIERKAELPLAYLNLAAVYYETGDLERAFTVNAKVFLLHEPQYLVDALFQKGLILLAMNKDEESRALYSQGRSLAEKNSDLSRLEYGIEELREALKGAKARPQTAEPILRSLQEAKRTMNPSSDASNYACRRLIL